jgi:hypothetical protein
MASKETVLRVPIRVDGLYIANPLELALPMADFSKLPYNLSNNSTINTDPPTPNLAEAAFHAALGRADGVFGRRSYSRQDSTFIGRCRMPSRPGSTIAVARSSRRGEPLARAAVGQRGAGAEILDRGK